MKLFCVSDIHGYYDVLISSLKNAGYDETNTDHKLLVIGDMVDRGHQPYEVLEYIYRLYKEDKAIVILGNHDDYLLEFFEGNFKKTLFNYERNGHKVTIDTLLGYESKDESTFETERKHLL